MSGLSTEQLVAIRDQFGAHAWHEVRLEDLARAAGVSRMTLHRRGVSKDDILGELGVLLAREFRDAALPALTATDPAPARLRLALRSCCEVEERHLGLIEALARDLQTVFHEDGEGEVLTRATFTDALARILQDGVREGTVALDTDILETATLLFNAAGWTYRHLRTGHRWSVEKATDRVVELLLHGVCS